MSRSACGAAAAAVASVLGLVPSAATKTIPLNIGSLGFGTGFATPAGTIAGTSGGGFNLPVVAAITFMIALTVIVLNLLVDLAYAYLDPRIRLGKLAGASA